MSELIILHEDNHLLVTVKPQNIPSQADSSGDTDMLSIIKDYLKVKYDKPGNAFAGLVHRLDRPTGGIMAFAKTSKAAERLSAQIRAGEFDKRYLAVLCRSPRDRKSKLVNYLIKEEATNTVRVISAPLEGSKRAELDYVILENTENICLADIKLLTGRSHQIRAQFSHLGCPLYADVKYGASVGRGDNLALWAYSLRLTHPVTNEIMVFKVFPPEVKPWTDFPVAKHINVVRPD